MSERKQKVRELADRALEWLREHRGRIVEHGKTLLIIALFCSACFFADQSGILGQGGLSAVREQVVSLFHAGDAGPGVSGVREYAAAARPQAMTVSPEAGTRHGAAYHTEVDEMYGRFSVYLGEALGTAGAPVVTNREAWELALSGTGVFFDFVEPQSLVCLAVWQGIPMPEGAEDAYARRLFLSVEDGGVALYYVTDAAGTVYRCGTAVDASALESRMGLYQSNNAYFVFEREDAPALDADTLIVPVADTVRAVSVTPAAPAGTQEAVLQLFGMNAITATSYQEARGTTVYLDGDSTLRMGTDGVITYERESGSAPVEMDLRGTAGLPDLTEKLYRLLQELSGETSECSEIRLESTGYDPRRDEYTVRFAYFIDGMQVRCAPGGMAEFTVSGGVMTRAQIMLRQYQFTGETQTPLPAVQAAALVAACGGTDPVRVYQDLGDRVTVSWKME